MKNYTSLKTILFALFFVQSFAFAAQTDCPQNIIFIIVDGGGFNHFKAARIYDKKTPAFENFPVRLAVTTFPFGGTYDANKAAEDFNYVRTGLITDSAAAATALSTGVKTSDGILCLDVNGVRLENVIEGCEKLGLSTGTVTTVPFSHATPAGFIVHQSSRNSYGQIADEMLNQSGLEVIFGCGNPFFDDSGEKLNKPRSFEYVGSAKIWDLLVEGSADNRTLIQTKQEFISLAEGNTPKRVIGIAHAASTLQEKRKGMSILPFDVPLNQNMPTLAEMTKAALNVLDDDNDGFFVMIEAGAVDWASHNNNGVRMLEEMVDFHGTVDVVIDWVQTKNSWRKTLVLITADHETGHLTVAAKKGRGKMPDMQWHSKSHTNSLVPFYAKGQGSKLFADRIKGKDPVYGSYIDNTDIAKIIFALLETKSAASHKK